MKLSHCRSETCGSLSTEYSDEKDIIFKRIEDKLQYNMQVFEQEIMDWHQIEKDS